MQLLVLLASPLGLIEFVLQVALIEVVIDVGPVLLEAPSVLLSQVLVIVLVHLQSLVVQLLLLITEVDVRSVSSERFYDLGLIEQTIQVTLLKVIIDARPVSLEAPSAYFSVFFVLSQLLLRDFLNLYLFH